MKSYKNPCPIQHRLPPQSNGVFERWATKYIHEHGNLREDIVKENVSLGKRILSFCGEDLLIPDGIEEDAKNILDRGAFYFGRGSIIFKGQPSQCHKNSCDLWHANKGKVAIATGYALMKDGLWRQHSWVVDLKEDIIVETTIKRLYYFGFVMTQEECEQFDFDNM